MQHDGGDVAYAPAKIVTTWPKGSFVENIAVAPDGAIFVTLHTDRAVVRVDSVTGAAQIRAGKRFIWSNAMTVAIVGAGHVPRKLGHGPDFSFSNQRTMPHAR